MKSLILALRSLHVNDELISKAILQLKYITYEDVMKNLNTSLSQRGVTPIPLAEGVTSALTEVKASLVTPAEAVAASVEVKTPSESDTSTSAKIKADFGKNKIVDKKSIPAFLEVIRNSGLDEPTMDMVEYATNIELGKSLHCTNDTEFGLILLTLKHGGLSDEIIAGCKAVIDTETGDDFPEYNPIFDIMLWVVSNEEHIINVKSIIAYLNECYK